MAPQTSIPPAANVLGTIGTVFWCIQLVPQIWYNWKRKKTEGLPALMMFLWAISSVPFGVYAIIQNFNMPIQIQPQIFCLLSLVSWGQILHYNGGWSAWKASLAATLVAIAFGGAELVLILTLRPLYLRGVAWPLMLVGILAAILLAAGLLPPYFELWKRSGRVVGIHWGFLAIDWFGAFFSLMGVVAQNTFDPLGGSLFIVCIVIEGGIFISHGIWLLRTRTLRASARAAGCAFDDLPDSAPYRVDVPRHGSIAASRDDVAVEMERSGSSGLGRERDLECGKEVEERVERDFIEEVRGSEKDDGVRGGKLSADGPGSGEEQDGFAVVEERETKRPGSVSEDTDTGCSPVFREPVGADKEADPASD